MEMTTTPQVASLEHYDDVVSWINDILDVPDDTDSHPSTLDLTHLEQQITQLVAALDIACEDTSSKLESIIDDVARGVPRLTYDLHFMRDSALDLQSSLATVLRHAQEVVPDAMGVALGNLRQLDTVKTRMEAVLEVLREAESWSSLEHEVAALISEKSYAKAAERLADASRSMVVFQNTSDYEPRKALMVNLQNQLEASLSSALVAAINAQNMVACKDYYSIFSIIQRESEFRNYYNATRRSVIVDMWQNAVLDDCGERHTSSASTSSTSFADFLGQFYTSFAILVNAERVSVCSIFPDPAATLSQFISTTLSSLQPTFPQRLSSLSEHYGDASLAQFIPILRVTEDFALGVEKAMEKIKYATNPSAERQAGSTEKPNHVRRRSSRMSLSWRPGQTRTMSLSQISLKAALDSSDSTEWSQELFQPFLDFQVDYASLERKFLENALRDTISSDSRENMSGEGRPRLFKERSVDIFGAAEGSLIRCKAFTHGYGAVGLVQTLDAFFRTFFDMWTAGIEKSDPSTYKTEIPISESDLEDLDYTAQDWSDIQLSLHLLSSGRNVFDRMTVYENKLRIFLSQTATQFKMTRTDPVNYTVAITKGESQLLDQSTLNSAELYTLLESAESEHARDQSSRHGLATISEPFLIHARNSLFAFAQTCQTSLHMTILSPLRSHLASYASLSTWNATSDPRTRSTPGDLQVPTFSLSPSDTIQRIAESLLNLPRLFEVYADDDGLAFSLHTLPYVDNELMKGLSEQFTASDANTLGIPFKRASVVYLKPTVLDPETVSSAWLCSLGHVFVQHMVTEILPKIPHLTVVGVTQLSSDLEYISNIVRALNVEHAELERWKMYIGMNDDDGRNAVAEDAGREVVLRQVARLRGW